MEQKTKQKTKKKSKTSSAQKIAAHAIQKQLQVLKLKEYLILAGFAFGGALIRVPMQALPSAEPITFFAILAGWLFGRKKGFMVGAGSLYISNFLVMGGQGPWTFFQMAAFGIAGYLGGFLKKKSRLIEVMAIAVIATIIFEILLNIASSVLFGFNIFLAFFTALPMTITHIISNIIFAGFLPKAKKIIWEKGGFNEKELCSNLIKHINNRIDNNRKQDRRQEL